MNFVTKNKCTISRELNTGNIQGISVDSCGDVCYTGLLLYTFYSTERQVRELLGLGNLASLGVRIGVPLDMHKILSNLDKDYINRHTLTTVCLVRDYGYPWSVWTNKSRQEFLERHCRPFNYIYRDGEWYVKIENNRLCKLESQLKQTKMTKEYIGLLLKYCTSDERKKLENTVRKLQLCKIDSVKSADYEIIDKVNETYIVRVTCNNSKIELDREDLEALKLEGCSIIDRR